MSWHERAACAGLSLDVFYPPSGRGAGNRARAVCARCPVVDACLQEAMRIEGHATSYRFGIWGGRNARERRRDAARAGSVVKWVKLSSSYYLDPKLLTAGEAAEVLFLRALGYCREADTGGLIHRSVPAMLCPRGTKARVQALVREHLWEPADDGYRVVAWQRWQEAGDDLAGRRRADRDRQARHRTKSRDVSRDTSREVTALEVEVEEEAAAAATREPPLPPDLEVLKARLDAARLVVRWDTLGPDRTAEVRRLVALHGDGPLVKAALAAFRPDSPPVFAQAWLAHWLALPPPGPLRAVPDRCTVHLADQPCSGCAADRKARPA